MKKRVLFVCTANAARSQMAEALLRHYAGDAFEVVSAGTEPGEVDPQTLDVLQAFGIATTGLQSKSVASVADQHFDFVISLCDKAHQECRDWSGQGALMAWDFPDPKQSPDPKAFSRTLHEISERIRLFILVNSKQVSSQLKTLSAVDFYKCLADESRLLSLLLIDAEDELCVCELVAALQLPQPKISRHLSLLRQKGILLDRRQGQWVYYRLHPLLNDWMRDVLQQTRMQSGELLQAPLARLRSMDGRPQGSDAVCQRSA